MLADIGSPRPSQFLSIKHCGIPPFTPYRNNVINLVSPGIQNTTLCIQEADLQMIVEKVLNDFPVSVL